MPDTENLTFTTDKGASRATWGAAFILIAIVGWMGSGYVFPSPQTAPEAEKRETENASVQVRKSTASDVTLYFRSEGQTQPDRQTAVRAQTTGDVAEVFVQKGDIVEENDLIARLSAENAQAALDRAQEEVNQAQREFDNASNLFDRGVATQDRVSEARAGLASAQANLTNAREGIESLDIRAPFSGRLETFSIDPGEFVQSGEEIGDLVDSQPLTIAIQVPQQTLRRLDQGQDAVVNFITGEERDGVVNFISSSANSETRTFLAEISVENDDRAIPAGISAQVVIPTGVQKAHFIKPAIISLDANGVLGVKTIDETNTVVFNPIQIIQSDIDGSWVTGLPDEATIITIGQGFVSAGEPVNPSYETGD